MTKRKPRTTHDAFLAMRQSPMADDPLLRDPLAERREQEPEWWEATAHRCYRSTTHRWFFADGPGGKIVEMDIYVGIPFVVIRDSEDGESITLNRQLAREIGEFLCRLAERMPDVNE